MLGGCSRAHAPLTAGACALAGARASAPRFHLSLNSLLVSLTFRVTLNCVLVSERTRMRRCASSRLSAAGQRGCRSFSSPTLWSTTELCTGLRLLGIRQRPLPRLATWMASTQHLCKAAQCLTQSKLGACRRSSLTRRGAWRSLLWSSSGVIR